MSFVIAVPEFLSAAATDLANLGSTISAANAAASIPTTGVLAAGADDVSAAIAALFGAHAQAYQTISAQAATFHAQFVQTLSAGAGAYANAEAANVQQSLLNAINAPTQALLGRPLIGDGADGTAPGQNGGAGGLAWPFLLLPQLGMIRGAAVTGIVNLAAAGVVSIFLLRHVVSGRQLVTALCALAAALGLIATLLVHSHDIETTGRQQLYADPIIAYRHSAYQEIVVTRRGDDLRLYLDGGLQFCTRDEYRYTESLVYPAVSDGARSVLVLGGGDGLAARELLRQPGIEQIVQVELDPAVIELARTTLRDVNAGSLDNPRVHVVIDDAMSWLRGAAVPPAGFDAVIVDLRDPDTPVLGRLYSTEFYALAARALAPGGLMVVQAGSPYSTPTAFWRIISTIRSAGYAVTPYHVHVPTFGDWGFALARLTDIAPTPAVPSTAPALRFLDQQVLEAATVFSGDIRPRTLDPSTLDNPHIVEDMRHGWD